MRLHPLHDVAVLADGAHRMLDVDPAGAVELGIEVPFEAPDEVVGDEGEHAARRRLGDEVPEAPDGHAARPALVDQGGRRRAYPDHVRVQPELSGDVLVDVGVGVDHPGDHELARHADHLRPDAGCEIGLHRIDTARPDPDVEFAVTSRRRIDDGTPFQDRVVRGGSPCRHVPSSECRRLHAGGCPVPAAPPATGVPPGPCFASIIPPARHGGTDAHSGAIGRTVPRFEARSAGGAAIPRIRGRPWVRAAWNDAQAAPSGGRNTLRPLVSQPNAHHPNTGAVSRKCSRVAAVSARAGYDPPSCLGPLAQLVEHLTFNQVVAGSIPARPTNDFSELRAFQPEAPSFPFAPIAFGRRLARVLG